MHLFDSVPAAELVGALKKWGSPMILFFKIHMEYEVFLSQIISN